MALVGISAFLTMFLFVYSLALLATAKRRRVAARIEALDPTPVRQKKRKTTTVKVGKREVRVNVVSNFESLLIRGEFDISARDFIVRWVLITLCISTLVFLIHGGLAAFLAALLSFAVTLIYLRMRSARRLQRFEEGLHDMLTITANSLRSGYSFIQAINVVTEDMAGPVQQEFARVLDEINVGVPLEQAFKSAAVRIQSEDFNLIVTAILIQRQVGGNLAEVLDQIASTIRERVRLKGEVKVLTAQGRMSGIIFMLLPIGVGTLMYILAPAYVSILFRSLLGIAMLVIAVILQVFGFLVIRKIVDIKI